MKNISFDNPYLLLVFIPLLIAILVPFILAFRKGYKGKGVITSLILHILIAACVSLAAANPTRTTVITQTDVFVLADVSYSANGNLDVIDGYIDEIEGNLPKNSRIGLVCFGKDYQLVSPLGESVVSVKEANVDDSATNISSALEYTASLFSTDSIKRIVLITDGKETDSKGTGELIAAIEGLYAQQIYLDAIYVDNNISADTQEIQIGGVEVKSSTYEGHEATASVVVQSNNQTETPATLYLYQNGEEIAKKTERFTHGFNVVNFTLPTDTEGEYDYEVRVATADEAQDTSAHNNAYLFTQRITAKMDILLVSPLEADRQMIQELYGEEAEIEAYIGTPNVPTAVEDLCKYDEIVLSNVDVRTLNNATAFVDSVDKAVALFGKSLVTFGDTKLQNKENDDFQMLEDMLPVKFGNSDNDPKLYGIVIDTSRSMQFAYRFMMMKEAAIQLLNILNPEDYVTVISFSGEIEVLQIPTAASNRAKIEEKIRAIEPTQGTFLGKGLATAYELMKDLDYSEKQVMLISDGMSYTLEEDDPVKIAGQMKEDNIFTSVINPNSTEGATALQNIANAGAPSGEEGRYYVIQDEKSIASLMFGEVANDVTETVIEERSPVKIKSRKDASVAEIETLPAVYGYVCSKAKANATTVLAVTYQRASGTTAEMPLYAHWSYGEGKVATFTSTLTGAWSLDWAEENSNGKAFFSNVVSANTPEEKIDYPYAFNVEYDGTYSTVQVTPATLKADGEVNAKITMPDGETVEQKLTFDSTKYFYQFETPQTGKYSVEITYTYEDKSYTSKTAFSISYSPEYDSFAVYNAGTLYSTVRNRGTVTENGVPTLENNEKEVATYQQQLTPPLMITAVALFVVDVIVRKMRWKDITALFKRKRKGGAK